ncbi:hypothetical protein ACFQRB_04760 [Halobaculum litoreum]|uniref:Uncharacterized protein n=1 Tax=Halobaculum litoreum TaxID=3031998 RepID=A0ABD5XRA1_9EURY
MAVRPRRGVRDDRLGVPPGIYGAGEDLVAMLTDRSGGEGGGDTAAADGGERE